MVARDALHITVLLGPAKKEIKKAPTRTEVPAEAWYSPVTGLVISKRWFFLLLQTVLRVSELVSEH